MILFSSSFFIIFICHQLRCLWDRDPSWHPEGPHCFTFNITYLPVISTVWLHHFLIIVKDIIFYSPWVTLYLIEKAFIKPNLHNLYLNFLNHLVDSSLIDLYQETIGIAIGLALHVNLSFDLSFNKPAILKNLGHWLGLQTLGRGILFLLKICLWGIVITALHRGSEDIIFAILFVVQFPMAGSSTVAFLPCFPYVRNILSLLAWLHTYPYIGL